MLDTLEFFRFFEHASRHVAEIASFEILDSAAHRAYEMMMIVAGVELIVRMGVLKIHLAHQTDIGKRFQRPVDRHLIHFVLLKPLYNILNGQRRFGLLKNA